MIEKVNEFITSILGDPFLADTWWIIIIVTVCFSLFESWWRRWFGGGKPNIDWIDEKFHVSTRVIKHGLNMVAVFALCYWYRGLEWYWSVYSAAVIEIFWALAHGPWYDIGRNGYPDEKMLKRYNKVIWHHILDWCFPKDHWYGHFYDFCGMLIRYTWPLLLLFWVHGYNIGLLLIGEIITILYALYRICRERYKDCIDVEYFAGLTVGLFMSLLGMV